MALPSALLTSPSLALMRCIDKGQSGEAHQHIYRRGRWGWMMMTIELWSSHWKSEWFLEISSTWVDSKLLHWAAGQKNIIWSQILAVKMSTEQECQCERNVKNVQKKMLQLLSAERSAFSPTVMTEFLLGTGSSPGTVEQCAQFFRLHFLGHIMYMLKT